MQLTIRLPIEAADLMGWLSHYEPDDDKPILGDEHMAQEAADWLNLYIRKKFDTANPEFSSLAAPQSISDLTIQDLALVGALNSESGEWGSEYMDLQGSIAVKLTPTITVQVPYPELAIVHVMPLPPGRAKLTIESRYPCIKGLVCDLLTTLGEDYPQAETAIRESLTQQAQIGSKTPAAVASPLAIRVPKGQKRRLFWKMVWDILAKFQHGGRPLEETTHWLAWLRKTHPNIVGTEDSPRLSTDTLRDIIAAGRARRLDFEVDQA